MHVDRSQASASDRCVGRSRFGQPYRVSKLAYNPAVVLVVVFALILVLELIFGGDVHLLPAVFGGLGAAAVSAASAVGTHWRAGRR
jgi:hypothetical protein